MMRVSRMYETSSSSLCFPGHELEKFRTVSAAGIKLLANSVKNSSASPPTSAIELCSRTTIDLVSTCGPSVTVTSIEHVDGNEPTAGAVQSTCGPVPTNVPSHARH